MILTELREHSPELVRMWDSQEVARYGDCKDHPPSRTRRIEVDAQLLYTENRAQILVVLTSRAGSESQRRLLSVIGRQQPTP